MSYTYFTRTMATDGTVTLTEWAPGSTLPIRVRIIPPRGEPEQVIDYQPDYVTPSPTETEEKR